MNMDYIDFHIFINVCMLNQQKEMAYFTYLNLVLLLKLLVS